jgi:predicted component of type VI protein secretion system
MKSLNLLKAQSISINTESYNQFLSFLEDSFELKDLLEIVHEYTYDKLTLMMMLKGIYPHLKTKF